MRPKKVAQKPENVLLVFLHSLCPAKTTHRWFESTGTETAPVGSGSPCGPPGGRNAGTGAQSACGRIPRPAPSTDRRFIAGPPRRHNPANVSLGVSQGIFCLTGGGVGGFSPNPGRGCSLPPLSSPPGTCRPSNLHLPTTTCPRYVLPHVVSLHAPQV